MSKKLTALPIVQFGDPVLRAGTKPMTLKQIRSKKIQDLIPVMFYTMRNIGVGLAAPQIGLPLRLAVIEVKVSVGDRGGVDSFPKTVVINPKILKYSKKKRPRWEGCLSLKHVAAEAVRADAVTVSYQDETGKKHVREFSGFTAQVFQHEIDHLDGTLYVDRIKDIKTLISTRRA